MNKGKALWLVATVLVLACATPPPVPEPLEATDEAAPARIQAIDSVVAADRTRVVLVSDSPLLYTSYEPDATKLVLEVQNCDTSALPSVVQVEGDAIRSINVSTHQKSKDFKLSRLEFVGMNVLDYTLHSEGTNLVLDFLPSPFLPAQAGVAAATLTPPPTSTADPVALEEERLPAEPSAISPETVPDPPAASPEPVPEATADVPPVVVDTPPASQLLGVDPVALPDGVRITLRGDGGFEYRTFTLENPDRLVLDLVGVQNTLGNRHLRVGADPVDQVRVAQFRTDPEPVARIVLDLLAAVPYRVVDGADSIDVVVGEGAVASLPPEPEPVAVAAAAHAVPKSPEPAPASTPVVAASAPEVNAIAVAAPAPEKAADAEATPVAVKTPAAGATGQATSDEPATLAAWDAAPPTAAPTAAPGEVPLTLDEMNPAAPDDQFVLFDQAADFHPQTARGTVPPQFQSTTIAGEQAAYTGERISLHFVEADLKNVFLFFSEFIGLNIVIDPEVRGTLTMHLDQVPWDQAFDVILRHQGLEKIVEGNVVRIATTDKLRAEASQRQALKQAQEQEVDPVTFTKVLSYAKVGDVAPILTQGVRSDRGRIVQDDRTNTLIITDVPSKRDAYQRLIDVLDTRTQQVMIEARIVETDRNLEQNLGINWRMFASADPALGTQTNLDFPHRATLTYDVNLPAAANAGTLGLSLGNVLDSFTLDIALEAFENEGKVRILSSPKITTQNNQTAVIEQGTQIPVVTTTAVEINVQYISASLKLQVTPQITAEETVIMDVVVENNSPDFVNRVGDVPPIITERAQTQILVHDGSTAVIGGIFKLSESNAEAGIPGLRKIPVIGWLFKNRAISKQNTELLVFITPKIVKSDA